MHFTKKQSNIEAFVNLHIRPFIVSCRQYFLQEDSVRFYFPIKITAEKVSMDFTGDNDFHILLLLSDRYPWQNKLS